MEMIQATTSPFYHSFPLPSNLLFAYASPILQGVSLDVATNCTSKSLP